MNFKLFRERAQGGSADGFIANLTEVDIVRASWKQGSGNERIAVPGTITTKSDVDLLDELVAGQAYFLAGAEGDRFDFELSGAAKAMAKRSNGFQISIL